MIPLNLNLILPTGHLMSLTSERLIKEGSYLTGWVIDPDNDKRIELLQHNGSKQEYVQNARDHLGCLLKAPGLMI